MKHYQKAAVLLNLANALKEKGSWCGETHIQKATFFLQSMLRDDLGYEFILYKHGPYSFNLKDDLSSFLADDIFSYEIKNANYGPSIVAGRRSRLVHEQYPKTSKRFAEQIDYVAGSLSDKNVKELEKLATALFVTMESTTNYGFEKRADRLHELKPHVLQAVQTLDSMCQQAGEHCVL